MSDELSIDDVRLQEDGEQVVVKIAVTNPSTRTLHAHVTPRKIHYDLASRTLSIELTDENMSTNVLGTTRQLPRFKAIDPESQTELRVTLPRIMHRMAAETPMGEPAIERLPIHEAEQIEVKVAWSDTPFYPDPRDHGKETVPDVVKWQKGVAAGRSSAGGSAAGWR